MSSEVGTAVDGGVVVRAVSEEDRASWESFRLGERNIIAFLGGEYETIDGAFEALIDERKEHA